MNIRLSLGSAINLGLKKGNQSVPPTTMYIMLGENCVNNCAFCTQARDSTSSRKHLSRIIWPVFRWVDVLDALRKGGHGFKRACFQTLSYDGMLDDLVDAIEVLKEMNIPASAAVGPLDDGELARLRNAGLDRVGIALDAANEMVFDNVKGGLVGNPYSWQEHLDSLERAALVFPGRTTTHLIVGLGETDEDLLDMMFWCKERGITVGLFAYTPFKGVRVGDAPPELPRYRAIQIARSLVFGEGKNRSEFTFENGRLTDMPDLEAGYEMAFQTSGCADCNRPYYNERVRGPIFNYPRSLTGDEHAESIYLIKRYLEETGGVE